MRMPALVFAALAALAAPGVQMASQPWTTNRIHEAEVRLSNQIAAATPGNYAAVSNAAMSAAGYTDSATNALAGKIEDKRGKMDMAVYGYEPWRLVWVNGDEMEPPVYFMWDGGENAWVGGTWGKVYYEGMWKYVSGTGDILTVDSSVDNNTIRFYDGSYTERIFTRDSVGMIPTADLLATKNQLAGLAGDVAAATNVLAAGIANAGYIATNAIGWVNTNHRITFINLSVAGGITTGGMTVYGGASVDGGSLYVNGTDITDAIAANVAGISAAAVAATNYTDAATNKLAQSMGGTPAEITVVDTVPYSKGLVNLTVTSGGTLACNTNGWTNGGQVMVDATLPATYTVASGIGPVGYSVLPSDGQYLLVFTRLGQAVYVSVITSVE